MTAISFTSRTPRSSIAPSTPRASAISHPRCRRRRRGWGWCGRWSIRRSSSALCDDAMRSSRGHNALPRLNDEKLNPAALQYFSSNIHPLPHRRNEIGRKRCLVARRKENERLVRLRVIESDWKSTPRAFDTALRVARAADLMHCPAIGFDNLSRHCGRCSGKRLCCGETDEYQNCEREAPPPDVVHHPALSG